MLFCNTLVKIKKTAKAPFHLESFKTNNFALRKTVFTSLGVLYTFIQFIYNHTSLYNHK